MGRAGASSQGELYFETGAFSTRHFSGVPFRSSTRTNPLVASISADAAAPIEAILKKIKEHKAIISKSCTDMQARSKEAQKELADIEKVVSEMYTMENSATATGAATGASSAAAADTAQESKKVEEPKKAEGPTEEKAAEDKVPAEQKETVVNKE